MGDIRLIQAVEEEKLAAKRKKDADERTARAAEQVALLAPIGPATSDQEIQQRAARLGYQLAVPAQLIASNLFLERRIARLEKK